MNIGARAHDYPAETVPSLLRSIAGDGWQGVQIAFHKILPEVPTPAAASPALVRETKQALVQNHLQLSVLGVYIEPSLADEAARKTQAAEFIRGISLAKELGAVCIGTETTNMANQPGVSHEAALTQLYKTVEEVLPHAQELGVLVAIEPVYNHALATPELAARLLRDMASPNLAVIFDPVNLLDGETLAGGHPAHKQMWHRAFEAYGDKIAAVHIKGVALSPEGLPAGRIPLKESLVDYAAVFDMLKQLPALPPILREEAVQATAKEDIAFLQSLA